MLPWLAVGLVAGLVISGFCPHRSLHATATDRYDTFAVATGPVDEGIEAIYFLDFLTGDLRAAVLSKQTGKFNAFFERNIIADLGVDPSKNPRYLMVTGIVDLRRGAAQLRPSMAAVYVAEITTGNVAAYVIPWDIHRHAAGQVFHGKLMPLDVTRFRTAAVRPRD
jgi:hypothetical protein